MSKQCGDLSGVLPQRNSFICKSRNFLRNNGVLLLMILPAIIYFFVFAYLPMAGVVLAFKDYSYTNGIFGSPWNGLKNFSYFFTSGNAWNVTRNTILYNIAFIIVCNILEITCAILLSELRGNCFKKISQSFMFLPYFISWVVVGTFIYNIFNYEFGALNSFLSFIGAEKVNVYKSVGAWKYILVFFNAWKNVGYGTIIYLATIVGIDRSIYEAAQIDGANVFKRIRHITFPSMIPSLAVLLLLNVAQIARGDFAMFYNIVGNNGMLYASTDVIDTFVFRSLMQAQEIGVSAAIGLYQSVLCFVIIITVNFIVRKIESDYALF